MYFDGSEIEVEPLKVKEELHWVFADLMAGKDTIKILADLNKCYPFASNEKEKAVHEALGKDNRMIVEKAKELIGEGKKEEFDLVIGALQERVDNCEKYLGEIKTTEDLKNITIGQDMEAIGDE